MQDSLRGTVLDSSCPCGLAAMALASARLKTTVRLRPVGFTDKVFCIVVIQGEMGPFDTRIPDL